MVFPIAGYQGKAVILNICTFIFYLFLYVIVRHILDDVHSYLKAHYKLENSDAFQVPLLEQTAHEIFIKWLRIRGKN